VEHISGSVGYRIALGNTAVVVAGDTGSTESVVPARTIWEEAAGAFHGHVDLAQDLWRLRLTEG
jgi:hypothetical protein